MSLEVVADPDRLSLIKEGWDALAARASFPSPCLTFEWHEAWWAAFGQGSFLHVVLVREGGNLVAVAPLMRADRREFGVRWRILSSATNSNSPIGGIVSVSTEGDVAREIVDHLLSEAGSWDIVRLDHVIEGPEFRRLIRELKARGVPHVVRRQRIAPVLIIEGTWDAFVMSRGRRFRESVRRKMRLAQAQGVKASIHLSPQDPDPLVDRAFSVASRGWVHRSRGTSIMSTEPLRRFYRGLALRAGRAGWLSFAFLEHEGRDVAFEWNLDYQGSRHNLKMGYDERYHQLSPGVVLRHHVLEDAFLRGLRAFHFLGDRESHKDHWATNRDTHFTLTLYGRSLLPRVRHFLAGPLRDQIRPRRALKAVMGRLFPRP